MRYRNRGIIAGGLVALAFWGCSVAPRSATTGPQRAAANESDRAAIAKARSDSARYPYTEADIHFMSGMIGHHAQAIKMAGWAPTHGASPTVLTLAERIINAQTDEIATMQQWLRDRRQPVPEPDPAGMKMNMGGMEHVMLMPGMLTPEQMQQLDAARGAEFDRLFLTDMIQHHRGAVRMVKELFESPGAGQDELVFKFASDVNVDQTTEIARMQRMLAVLTIQGRAP
ncbi:MAG TPA: DUF305 domain-containing protein [Gemmatimonadaceae bacterium]|jgi:uncharacterized protein (DUF305 family)|nr:DUF305 domain-containing protein [Gemmatimonadaceae bacterium]